MCLLVAYGGVFFLPLTQFLLMGTKKRNTICSRRELSSQPGLLTSAWWSGISVGGKTAEQNSGQKRAYKQHFSGNEGAVHQKLQV